MNDNISTGGDHHAGYRYLVVGYLVYWRGLSQEVAGNRKCTCQGKVFKKLITSLSEGARKPPRDGVCKLLLACTNPFY